MKRVLVLRPEPGASATAGKARALGLTAQAVPLFDISPIAWSAPEAADFDGVLLTSANALRHAGDKLAAYRGLPVYAVGEATAEAARQAGFGIASTGNAGVDRLLDSIEPRLKLLHLCGEDRRDPEQPKQHILAVPVYRSTAIQSPRLGNTSGCVALVHSPRAGQRLGEIAEERSGIALAAISAATAEAAGDGWASVDIADEPSDEALLALAARLCNKPDL